MSQGETLRVVKDPSIPPQHCRQPMKRGKQLQTATKEAAAQLWGN